MSGAGMELIRRAQQGKDRSPNMNPVQLFFLADLVKGGQNRCHVLYIAPSILTPFVLSFQFLSLMVTAVSPRPFRLQSLSRCITLAIPLRGIPSPG
jgi:hypothetical protein